jgi:glutamate N-acetyltransferase/amino-acid N-acetyltransferase
MGRPLDPLVLNPVEGVRLGTVCAGIKRRDRDDVTILEICEGAHAAAVFTRNLFRAAPVEVAREHLRKTSPRFLLINSGNANAGTGTRGREDALATCVRLAEAGNCPVEAVLPFSTGVIGEPLPVALIEGAIPKAVDALSRNGWQAAAKAIMTTDTVPKGCTRVVQIGGCPVTITGIAKGAGMIHPDMATMLAFIATDAAVHPAVLDRCLHSAVEQTFNRITVDGDTSTNDACVLVATGKAALLPIEHTQGMEYEALQAGVMEVCLHLAHAIVRDGEGATKFIGIKVTGGRTEEECLQIARAVALSPLVKTAFFASDPNWGRILAAVGRAGVADLEIQGVTIHLDEICIVRDGARALDYTEAQGRMVMARPDITVSIDLGRGTAYATVWTCDFSYDYVRINAEYRT